MFEKFSGLKINRSKSEIAGIGVKNGVQVALWDIKCINLNNECIKILGIHHAYNKRGYLGKNYKEVAWRWRNLTLSWKNNCF